MQENVILQESVDLVRARLGARLASITIERAVFGLFFSGVKLSTGQGGLCFTPIKDIPEAVCCPSSAAAMPLSGKLRGRCAENYLEDIFGDNILKKALGIATLNALSSLIWELEPPTAYSVDMGRDAFDGVDVARFEKTVVIGALVPMLKKLIAGGCDFRILEQDSRTLKPRELPYYAPAEDAPKYVPGADLLVITGVTILNDTLPGILKLAKPGAQIIVTGPTASMLPDALFARGVTMAGGILVTKADALLDIISEGGSGYHFFGKSAERTVICKSGDIA
ncbi:MAG: DUF364 domain-containing protein [Christensenellaceae bacterium]|jgi:uncharacterized protein (DUF4213/DUF364 family)|nr:DUF364 domain-containing protein [Christensenellaceae bacterium]